MPFQAGVVDKVLIILVRCNPLVQKVVWAFSHPRKPGFPSKRAPSRLVALRLSASGHLPGNPSRIPAHDSFYHPRFATSTKMPNLCIPICIVLVCRDVMKIGLKKYRSITHTCGFTRSFTHAFLWIGTFFHPRPIRSFTHALIFQSQHWRGFPSVVHSRNARAHFLTYIFFNAFAVYDRGTPSGFPQPSVGSPSR